MNLKMFSKTSIKCEHLLQLSTCFHNELSVVTSIHSECDITEVFVNDFDYYSAGNYACVEDFASVLPITAPIFIELNLTKFLKLEVVIFFKSLFVLQTAKPLRLKLKKCCCCSFCNQKITFSI